MSATELTDTEQVALARLHALLELLPTALDQELSAAGLTAFEYTLLQSLATAEHQRLRLSALASQTNASLPRLSRVMNALERKGLVMRAPCEADGRATNAVLTDAGAAILADARPRYADAARRLILGGLDGEGVSDLARMALTILTRLDPDRRMTVTADGAPLPDSCPADPPAH